MKLSAVEAAQLAYKNRTEGHLRKLTTLPRLDSFREDQAVEVRLREVQTEHVEQTALSTIEGIASQFDDPIVQGIAPRRRPNRDYVRTYLIAAYLDSGPTRVAHLIGKPVPWTKMAIREGKILIEARQKRSSARNKIISSDDPA